MRRPSGACGGSPAARSIDWCRSYFPLLIKLGPAWQTDGQYLPVMLRPPPVGFDRFGEPFEQPAIAKEFAFARLASVVVDSVDLDARHRSGFHGDEVEVRWRARQH